ncbi:hypothetical protein CC80DRAFT_453545 [Byssothecium circinans]|uniref:Uncharacterized protein n=1 Tax=Byssothecium circinans TaxID=147558 RepID=A0A6A5TLJ6_9PLEO|nr:hypothetical protein CC80DRAFT_453545 [Byssothecium circinans]
MPIPSLTSALKPRNHISRARDTPSRSEVPRQRAEDARSDPPAHSGSLSQEPSDSSSNQPNGNDAANRRSFLPQRGLPRSFPRTVGATDSPSSKVQHERTQSELSGPSNARGASTTSQQSYASGAQQGRPRPRSLYQQRPTNLSTETPAGATKPSSSTGIQRSASLRHPGVTGQPPQPSTRGHARTRSTQTMTAAKRETTEVKPRTERTRSLMGPPSQVTRPTSGAAADAAAGIMRTSARSGALNRSASTKAKPEVSRDRATAPGPTTSEGAQNQAMPREVAKEESRKLARPAFSTLQQHFTPRKTGKAPTSTFLHPVADTSTQYLPPEIIALQTELLQLHLLHQVSAQTTMRWELSAQKSLRVKFDEVASLYQVMREYERLGLEQKNVLALREWNGANAPSGLVEHIQALSGPLNELPSLLDSGGRYRQLVHDFDRWISNVEEVLTMRNCHDSLGHSASIEGLGDRWKEENAVLTRKLTSLLRDLDRLPPTARGSSIACIVETCKQLLEGLTDELQVMQVIEHDVVAKEKQWVEDRLRVIAHDIGARLNTVVEGGEAWRA